MNKYAEGLEWIISAVWGRQQHQQKKKKIEAELCDWMSSIRAWINRNTLSPVVLHAEERPVMFVIHGRTPWWNGAGQECSGGLVP